MRARFSLAFDREAYALAVEHVWCAAWAALGNDPATTVDDTAEVLRIITPQSTDLLLNAILRFRQPRPVTAADVERVIAPFRVAGRPWQWWLRLGAEPVGLRERMVELGMQCWGTPTGMTLPLRNWHAPNVSQSTYEVRPAVNSQEIASALDIICTVFGMTPEPMRQWGPDNPHFVAYLAWHDGVPVGALVQQISGGVVGIFHVATLPRLRRQGIAHALMCQVLRDAQSAGAHTAALTASPMAETLYHRLGFVSCCVFELWMPGPRLLSALRAI